jgi:hypothetical protein
MYPLEPFIWQGNLGLVLYGTGSLAALLGKKRAAQLEKPGGWDKLNIVSVKRMCRTPM